MGGKGTKRLKQATRGAVDAHKRHKPAAAGSTAPRVASAPLARVAVSASAASNGAAVVAPETVKVNGYAALEGDNDTASLPDEAPEVDVDVKAPAGGGKRVIIVLDKACLEPVKSKSGKFELLNCDDHLALHKRLGKDPADSRPDIAHQCLLSLLDSPLNKAGLLTVILRTETGVLVEIDPSIRIPRTFKRFAGLMVQLLHKVCLYHGPTAALTRTHVFSSGFAPPRGQRLCCA